ncbi:MAG: 5'-nucleotidase C-terminal domain-containing protein [Defluviitaleaceae bacterium]|nr:5'-nucleotidase C-terminal domain-containing protein [Defluviitaleaceae bacterium]
MRRIKLILTAVLVFVLTFAITAPLTAQAAAPEGSVTITILHTNDMHGRLAGTGSVIGIDRIAAILAETDNAILVDAGDAIHGLPLVDLKRGLNAITLMNAAGYSLLTPGNHEFNHFVPEAGVNHLFYLQTHADFEILAANVTWKDTGEAAFNGYTIIEIDGVKVGFFGLAQPDTPTRSNPAGVVGLNFGDPVSAAKLAVAALQEAGADVIVAIAHLDVSDGEQAIAVAEEVPGIHVMITGHCHTRLPEGEMVGDVLLVQTGAHAANVGAVEIVITNGEIESITASLITHAMAQEFEPVAEVTALIAEMQAEINAELGIVIAYNPETLLGDDPENRPILRGSEVPLGNLIADAIRIGMGTDFAIINSGGIRAHLNAGEVTLLDIQAILPFFNTAMVLEITPAVLWELLEFAVSVIPDGRFPQVSGFSFVLDGDAPAGERIPSIAVNGTALSKTDDTTVFTITLNNFMASGGDGFSMLVDMPILAEGNRLDVLLAEHIMNLFPLPAVEEEFNGEAEEVEEEAEEIVEAVTLPALFPLDEIARQVINGNWGNGVERVRRLTEAGYDARAVQTRVNQILR